METKYANKTFEDTEEIEESVVSTAFELNEIGENTIKEMPAIVAEVRRQFVVIVFAKSVEEIMVKKYYIL